MSVTTHAATDTPTGSGPRRDPAIALALGRKRKRTDLITRILCIVATTIGLAFLVSILFYVGVAGGIATVGFAIYIGFVMDRGPRRRAPGRGLARPVGKGRR